MELSESYKERLATLAGIIQEEDLNRYEQNRLLKQNKPVYVYRGTSSSGKNFYQGEAELPYTYYSLTTEKASYYGNVQKFIFNPKHDVVKIFSAHNLFEKFGHSNIEDKNVIETLKKEGFSAIIYRGDELIVLDKNLIKPL